MARQIELHLSFCKLEHRLKFVRSSLRKQSRKFKQEARGLHPQQPLQQGYQELLRVSLLSCKPCSILIKLVLDKYRLVYNRMSYTKVQDSVVYKSTALNKSTDCSTPPAYILYMICSHMESNSVLVAGGDTTSALSPTRRGARLNTYGMRNRRQNVYVSPEICAYWVGCLISTTTFVGTY